MRLLLILAVAAAALWSGYWAVTAHGLETGVERWLAVRRDDGWAADAGTIEVRGFPTRFETRITALALADPDTGLSWAAPEFRIEADSHRPLAITAIWPVSQQLATPGEKIAVGAERMQGALHFRPGPDLALTEGRFDLDRVTLVSTAGWQTGLSRGTLTMQAVEGDEDSYRIAFTAEEMRPPVRLTEQLDRVGVLPDVFDYLRLSATVGFDAPWDRHAVEDRRPQITAIDLALLDAKWGDLALQAAGALTVDTEGTPEGELTLRATNWREMVEIARASGRLPDGLADRVEDALGLLAGLSGRPETLDIPLRLARGLTWLGPMPIGSAPDLTIR